MLEFQASAGAVVAADTRTAVAAFDRALLDNMRLCMSFIEATGGTNLPAARSQKALASMTSGITAAVEGRGQIVSAIRQLTAMKRDSTIAPVDFGCPEGWESALPFTTAAAEDPASVPA